METDGTEKTPEQIAAAKPAAKAKAKDNFLLSNRRANKRVFGLRMAKGFDPTRERDTEEAPTRTPDPIRPGE